MEKRGFENPNILLNWNSFHIESKNYFPSRIITNNSGKKILVITPENKMAGIKFAYIKQDLLLSLRERYLFREISDIILAKME